jgi:AcrR family transcriptional regulator
MVRSRGRLRMTPRPRKVSDEDVLRALRRVMAEVGPDKLTLNRVAAEAGVTAGALVQRFGSRRGLLLTLLQTFASSASAVFAELRREHASPLAALRAYARRHAGMGETPETLAHHLAWLQLDLMDPEFRDHMGAHARDTAAELCRLLSDAVTAGELRDDSAVEPLARAVHAVITGSLFVWATLGDGDAASSVLADLDAVLAPYLAG